MNHKNKTSKEKQIEEEKNTHTFCSKNEKLTRTCLVNVNVISKLNI